MALNISYGAAPGESLIANASSQINANRQRDIDRQLNQQNTGAARLQQQEQFDKQYNLQKTLGIVNAGVNIAQTAMGIPNFLESIKDLAGPTARQQQAQQHQENVNLQRDQLKLQTLTQGANAGVAVFNAAKVKANREATSATVEGIYGDQQAYDSIPQVHQSYIMEQAQAGDPMAMDQAFQMGLLTHTDHQQQRMASLEADISMAQSDPTLSPVERTFAISQAKAELQAIRMSPTPNRNRPMTSQEVANSSIRHVPMSLPDGTVFMQPTKRGRDGNYDPFDTPYTEGLKAQAKKAGEFKALQEHAKLNPQSPEARALRGEDTKRGPTLFAENGTVNLAAIEPTDLAAADKIIIEAKKAEWEANSIDPLTKMPKPGVAAPSFIPTYQDRQNYWGSILKAPVDVRDNMQLEAGAKTQLGSILMGRSQGSMAPNPPGIAQPNSMAPTTEPIAAPQQPLIENGTTPGPALREPSINPPMANVPSGEGSTVKIVGPANAKPQFEKQTTGYMEQAKYVPDPPGMTKSIIRMSGTNIAKKLGLDQVVVYSDANGEIPSLPSEEYIARYAKVAGPGARFVSSAGTVRKIKPAAASVK